MNDKELRNYYAKCRKSHGFDVSGCTGVPPPGGISPCTRRRTFHEATDYAKHAIELYNKRVAKCVAKDPNHKRSPLKFLGVERVNGQAAGGIMLYITLLARELNNGLRKLYRAKILVRGLLGPAKLILVSLKRAPHYEQESQNLCYKDEPEEESEKSEEDSDQSEEDSEQSEEESEQSEEESEDCEGPPVIITWAKMCKILKNSTPGRASSNEAPQPDTPFDKYVLLLAERMPQFSGVFYGDLVWSACVKWKTMSDSDRELFNKPLCYLAEDGEHQEIAKNTPLVRTSLPEAQQLPELPETPFEKFVWLLRDLTQFAGASFAMRVACAYVKWKTLSERDRELFNEQPLEYFSSHIANLAQNRKRAD